ncbi:hypothetical protein AB0F72_09325 [Actinoplanes sp. NPDC023936]|uniref:hypothetical protein n=1 Tax=Actinoplanes sp. NPDC023936 TaxID=3154910 RepID=UPI0033DDB6A6
MPDIEYGYARDQQWEVCAHVEGADRMVCGRLKGVILVSIEDPGADLHSKCRDLLAAGVYESPPRRRGPRCRVCGEIVALVGGLAGPHGGCVGVNLPPRGG